MGCWNKTCFLTNLPIFCGEDVYIVFLQKKTSGDKSLCYGNALYTPAPFLLEAKYNDYGGAENCEPIVLNLILNEIKSHMVEMDVGENEFHDISVKKADLNGELLFDAIHEKRLFLKYISLKCISANTEVGMVMIKKTVLDNIFQKITLTSWTTNTVTTYPEMFAELHNHIKKYKDFYESIDLYDMGLGALKKILDSNIANFGSKLENFRNKQKKLESSPIHGIMCGAKETMKYAPMFNNLNLINQDPKIVESYFNFCCLQYILDCTRRIWVVTCQEGSQAGIENNLYSVLNDEIRDEINRLTVEDEDGEEDDEKIV